MRSAAACVAQFCCSLLINQLQSFLVSIKRMESLPPELWEKILIHLTYPEQGKLLTVSRRWNMVIEGLLPSTRSVTIRGRNGKFGNGKFGTYSLYSSYKDNPVYVSDKTHTIRARHALHARHARMFWLYLYKMENVWYERCETRFVSQRDSWRWYVSEEVGNLKIQEGFLQSNMDSTSPLTSGSSWTWFKKHDYGWCGTGVPYHADIDKIQYIDYNHVDETPLDDDSRSFGLIEGGEVQRANPQFPSFPSHPEYRAIVLHSYSGGGKDSLQLSKDDVVTVLGPTENGCDEIDVRKNDGEEGVVPTSCIKGKCQKCKAEADLYYH